MTESPSGYRTPYTPTPGSSTTAPGVGPEEGKAELWSYFYLALLDTLIIAVVGISAWLYVHHVI